MKGWHDNSKYAEANSDKIRWDRRLLRFLKNIKTWQILLILLLFILLAAIFLRLNNLNMIDRREALVKADKTGNIAKIETAAQDLQSYVAHHMNTSTGRIALQTYYEKAAQNAIDAAKPPEISTDVYQKATDACMPQLRNYGYSAWASCVADHVGVVSGVPNQKLPAAPDPDAYYVDFAPVRWSPDCAGFSVLICLILTLVVVVRLVMIIVLRAILKFRYRAS